MVRNMVRKLSIVAVVMAAVVATGVSLKPARASQDDPPEKGTRLPEGVRHVPPDALFFIHFRVADFFATDQGKSLLEQIGKSKELAKIRAEAEKVLGMSLSDVESATVFMLGPPPGWDPRFGMGPADALRFREKQLRDFGGPGKTFLSPDEKELWMKHILPYIEQQHKYKDPFEKEPPFNEKPKEDGKSKSKGPPQVRQSEVVDGTSNTIFFQRDQEPPFGRLPAEMFGGKEREFPVWDPERSQGVVLTARKALDRKKLLATFVGDPREDNFRRKPGVLFLSDRSVLIGPPEFLTQYADSLRREGVGPGLPVSAPPLQRALELAAGKHIVAGGGHVPKSLRAMLQRKMQGGPSSYLAMVYPIINLELAGFTLDLGEKAMLNVRLFGRNERSTELAAEAVKTALVWTDLNFEKLVGAGTAKLSKNSQTLVKKLREAITSAKVEHKGTTANVQLVLDLDAATLHAALAEAVSKVQLAAGRVQSQNNLKQIALAMHNYHDTFGGFPPPALSSIKNKDGKPLLSWRVAILPFIEQQQMYQQFKLDEPWDSPHNKKLIAQMPSIYAAPNIKTKEPGLTYYQVFVGPGTAFEPIQGRNGPANIRIVEIQDGTSNTLMVVEAGEPVLWTKPDDVPFDPKGKLPKLGGVFEEGFNAALCDGSVRFIRRTISAETLRALITRNGGEVIGNDFDD